MDTILIKFILIIVTLNLANGSLYLNTRNPAFDQQFYENALDSELCEQQLQYIANNTSLRLEFLDSGLRPPKYILKGNTLDLGSYYPCLEINHDLGSSVVEGKYCMISVPLQQDLQLPSLPDIPWPDLIPNITAMNEQQLREIRNLQSGVQMLSGEIDDRLSSRVTSDSSIAGMQFDLGFCIPKACTTKQALRALYYSGPFLGLEYQDEFCRLPKDKPWVPVDYVAIVILTIIGILTILSTAYDIHHTLYLDKDPKSANTLCKSFSVYTNTRRLLTFPTNPGAIECIDGLRTLAMMWVILGHTFTSQLNGMMANPLDAMKFATSAKSLWITAAPITVDTFFMLSGLLLVYATVGKLTGMKLIKNIHLFYLNRILRMFPLLALTILLQASIFHRAGDGPYWTVVFANKVEKCRTYWWSTLLYVQNYMNPQSICLTHSWYLAVDMQLHIISPIFLFWVLGKRRGAWTALAAGMLISLTASTVYNFINNFPSAPILPSRLEDQIRYIRYYYMNTLTRASPFFVGMIYGYILYLYRGKTTNISKLFAAILWLSSITLLLIVIYITYPMMQSNWNYQNLDNVINSFMRPIWALALGWIIFACVHGYGGPLNWFLSQRMWKLPARLSYAMYLIHFPLMYLVNTSMVAPIFFSVPYSMYKFFADFSLSITVAFLATLLVDSPFSTLTKLVIGGGPKRPHRSKKTDEIVDNVPRIDGVYGLDNPAYDTHISKTQL